ncbi:fatty acid repression mutant protein [Chaetomium fimeti]|uniref:Fatty acid repression mutant protein n=1 Tax=Chaetomium fimeti TaxID=1854472 RepID=A0AAE0HIE6_9PEZI|nr:fatty acid repression mutant protein [Chaetomium fimeti]
MQRLLSSISRALSKPRPLTTTTTPLTKPTTPRPFTTTTTAKMGSTTANADSFLSQIAARRSFYPLNKTLPIPTTRVQSIIGEALQQVPSSFNSQSNRVVVLLGAEHDKFWDATRDILQAIVPEGAAWEATAGKMAMFRGAAGTALFFEDQEVVQGMQAKFATYADRFPIWAGHSSGMLQFAVWTALEAEGLGANLQHYNPLVDAKVAEEWNVPATWKLSAQLVFGGKTSPAGEKTFTPLEDKLKVYGA